jgi:predicted RNA-binding Zn-ribbon protein involved in translation (DUF1610 family)
MPKKTASGKDSRAWANFERAIAAAYRAAGFCGAYRKTRTESAQNTSRSDWDVGVPEVPGMVDDMKYQADGWGHHEILERHDGTEIAALRPNLGFPHHTVFENQIEQRYLKGRPERFGVMHTKSGKERGSFVTVRLETWVSILALAFLRNQDSSKWSCPRCGHTVARQPSGMGSLVTYTCLTCGLAFLSEDNQTNV